ncbi:MAG: calcium-binding protein, partial [Maritimibacter sp.]|nr:calcium-binding protein [Maritimibacter sp.]
LFGTDGDDVIAGSSADNTVYARDGDDLVHGRAGADTLYGGAGSDTLDGDSGRDRIYGEAGRDWLVGGDGRDRLFGGAGRDRLIGGDGNDRLKGGTKADDFVFRDGFGTDRILDFDATDNAEDIVLRGVTSIRSYSDLVAHHLTENAEGDAVIDDGQGNTITLAGVALDDLGKGDFLF